jgi:hypothetical protein
LTYTLTLLNLPALLTLLTLLTLLALLTLLTLVTLLTLQMKNYVYLRQMLTALTLKIFANIRTFKVPL